MFMLRGGPATTFEMDQSTGNLRTTPYFRASALSTLLPTKVQVNTPGACSPPDIASEFGCLTPKVVVSSNMGGNTWGCPPGTRPYNERYCMRTESPLPSQPPTMTPTQVFTPPSPPTQMQTCWDGTQIPANATCPPVPQSATPPPIDQPTPGTMVFETTPPTIIHRVPWWAWALGIGGAVVGGVALLTRR